MQCGISIIGNCTGFFIHAGAAEKMKKYKKNLIGKSIHKTYYIIIRSPKYWVKLNIKYLTYFEIN